LLELSYLDFPGLSGGDFFDQSFLYGGGRGRRIGIPTCPSSSEFLDIDFNAVAEGVREAGLGQQVVAPGNGLVEVSGLGPATGGALAVRPGFFVETGARQRSLGPSSIFAASASEHSSVRSSPRSIL